MNRPTVWLFDLDGTLVDTAPDLIGALNEMREARQMAALDHTELRSEASNGARGLLRAGLQLEPEHAGFDDARNEFLERYAARLSRDTQVFPQMPALLDSLARTGKRWGIVTNKPIALARPLIADLGLQPAVLLGGDSAPRPKPDPAALWLACAHLGVHASECLYLGDAPRDIDAGRAAGMQTVACGWGYVEGCPDPADWGADLYARDIDELHLLLR